MKEFHIDISDLIAKSNAALIQGILVLINYDNKIVLKENKFPKTLANTSINIYALWIRTQSKHQWELMYIGQRHSNRAWGRVRQHLFSTPKGTQSKLAAIQTAVEVGSEIGLTTILVKPDSLRLSVEEELIALNNPPWNR